MLRPREHALDLHELLDGVAYLLVEDAPVRDDDDGVEHRLAASVLHLRELMHKPRNRIGLPAPGGMLYEIPLPDAAPLHVGEQLLHRVQLVVARKYLLDGLFLRLLVRLLHHLRIVLDDAGELPLREDVLPEVVRHDAVGIRRIARAVLPPLVERQEPARLARKPCAELDRLVVHGEMHHRPSEREQRLVRVAVLLVLLDRILRALLRQLVLQLEGYDGKSVDEHAEVERKPRRVGGVPELPRHAEDVFGEVRLGRGVLRPRQHVEHDEVRRIDLHALAQHVDDAALHDLAVQAVEELPLLLLALENAELRHLLRLRFAEKTPEPRLVNGVLAVVVGVRALLVAVRLDKVPDNQRLQPAFARVGRLHGLTLLSISDSISAMLGRSLSISLGKIS